MTKKAKERTAQLKHYYEQVVSRTNAELACILFVRIVSCQRTITSRLMYDEGQNCCGGVCDV